MDTNGRSRTIGGWDRLATLAAIIFLPFKFMEPKNSLAEHSNPFMPQKFDFDGENIVAADETV